MPVDSDLLQRVTRLEIQLQNANEKVEALQERVGYYDKMALKWGSFCLGMVFLGGLLWAGVDKLKDRILSWFP